MCLGESASNSPPHGLGGLAVCSLGICICYIYYGLLLEKLFADDDRLSPNFLLVTQCATNSALGFLWQQVMLGRKIVVAPVAAPLSLPYGLILGTAFFYVTAMGSSNIAIKYVSFPVAVLAKSCKLIPIMLVGQVMEKKLYSRTQWMAALFISSGIVIFHLSRIKGPVADINDEQDHTTTGMLLLLLSLVMDGVLASCQNFVKRSPRPPTAVETMLYLNLFANVFLVPVAIATGQLERGFHHLFMDATLIWNLLALNVAVAVGQVFVFLTVTWYSPVVTTTITTTRKFFTILLSVVTYGHSFTIIQWGSIGLVFTGLYLAILVQQRERQNKSKVD